LPIYEFSKDGIVELGSATFSSVGLQERRDLQRLLRENIGVIAPGTLVISEEFGEWAESKRRIDLLAIDQNANLVVIELKRTEDGGHMELQAIRYASMVSTMTFERAVEVFGRFLKSRNSDQDPLTEMLDFLRWDEPNQGVFARDVRIVLASAEFSKEITSSVLWLTAHDIDIRCVRLRPYNFEGRILVDVQQIIPLPEAADYQEQFREKERKEREVRSSGLDFTRYDVDIDGEHHSSNAKRNAIFLICKHLCSKGVNPDEIAEVLKFRKRIWYFVDGQVTSVEFLALAQAKATDQGGRFDSRRWFLDDDELIYANGKTYTFSDQWGGDNWRDAMNALKEYYAKFAISFAEVR
jgi:hypothetical protein